MKQTAHRPKHIYRSIGFFLLPFALAILTAIKQINQLTLLIPAVVLAILLILRFLPKRYQKFNVFLWTLLVLSLVGSTGWFFSPFFFTLYLVAIAIGFVYTPAVSVAFTLSLLLLFAFSMTGERPTFDFLTLLSLLTVIPIVIGLRKSYLLVQQERKGILILEQGDSAAGIASLDSILTNRINNIGVTLRQPITYLKQGVALLVSGTLSQEEVTEMLPRMQKSTEELFTLVKEFERETTNNKFHASANPSVLKKP